ncbi:hypothetical protein KCP70_05025 [Salmonella enterica subsp. enterica]|nr:hypothetical protein KCP70_05025 [Salmonella enterica subsp. enterica]
MKPRQRRHHGSDFRCMSAHCETIPASGSANGICFCARSEKRQQNFRRRVDGEGA